MGEGGGPPVPFGAVSFEAALRLTEMLLGWSLVVASLEHLGGLRRERLLFAVRLLLALCLVAGAWASAALLGLCATGVVTLWRFQGPYNGGSDRMGLLILFCLTLAHILPPVGAELALGYLAVQVVLSYVISGQVKLVNPDWRSGTALGEVFAFSAYPGSPA